MELATHGNLRHMLDDEPDAVRNDPALQVGFTTDIVRGMAYLHSRSPKPVLHHDVKSGACLC